MRLLVASVLGSALLQIISADPLCDQYLKCQEAVKAKQSECPHGAGKRAKDAVASNITACEEATTKQQQLRDIIEKKVEDEHACIAEASSKTTDKEKTAKGKCAKLSSRLTAGEALFGVSTKKKGGKKEKKEKEGDEKAARSECNRALHALRQECRVLHKCCGAAAECAPKRNLAENDELRAKKKEVKDALKQCKTATKAEKKQRKQEKKKEKKGKKEKKEKEVKVEKETEVVTECMRGFVVFVLFLILLIVSFTSLRNRRVKEREEIEAKIRNEKWSTIASLFSAVFNELVGRFQQINSYGDPIYKHVSGGTLGMEQISRFGEPLFKANQFENACQLLGKSASYGAIAANAYTVLSSAPASSEQSTVASIFCSSSKAAAGYYGAFYGASFGGALLSSFIPVVGTLVGAVIGGSAGVYLGSAAGAYAAAAITSMPGC